MKNPLKKFDNTSLYDQVADRLCESIIKGNLHNNEKLPSEQKLAELYGVSRNVVREALKVLKERGIIELRNGAGSYVKEPDASDISKTLACAVMMEDISSEDIYDVRVILETASVGLAAEKINEIEIENLKLILNKLMDLSLSVEERRNLDFKFHIDIAKASDNRLLLFLIQVMKDLFIDFMEVGIYTEGGIQDASTRHERILRALENHDVNQAKKMMNNHLAASRENVKHFEMKQVGLSQ